MAILNVNFMSESLMRTVDVQIILPVDKMPMPGVPKREEKPFQTLYLLHGILGDQNDWIKGTRIALWAQEKNLAVVMPAGENQFYTNQECPGFAYGDFIGKELVKLTRRMLPLSETREDTFIGGLSMGGYGALYHGLTNSSTFGAVVALSSALVTEKAPASTYENSFMADNRFYFERCFGNLDQLLKSRMHLPNLAKELAEQKLPIPDIYMACGQDDFLLEANEAFVKLLTELGVPVTFEKGPGSHEWEFWDTYIKKALDWLPLEQADGGLHSGNIGK